LRVPVLVTHGTMDRIVLPAAGSYTAAQVQGARLSLYDGVGHSPFFEDPTRFNRELAALEAPSVSKDGSRLRACGHPSRRSRANARALLRMTAVFVSWPLPESLPRSGAA
jgi:hypothetical protein